jgi:replicative DNA helicase
MPEEDQNKAVRRIADASDRISEAALRIDDNNGNTLAGIKAGARRWKQEKGLDLVVVDYIGLITPAPGASTRENEISILSRGFKALARELDVPVVLLVQLNRSVENRQIKKPMLSDLRESGALEQDADMVIFIYREEYYKTSEDVEDDGKRHIADIIVAKNRNGATGTIKLFWNANYTLFQNLVKGAF